MVHVEPIKDDGRPVTLGTGGTSGIGQATARMLAVRGWHVISVGLDTEESIPETQRLGRGELFTYEMDVTKPADIMCILNALPRLDAIVHCAGFGIAGSAECTPMTLARKQFDVNYFGVLQVNELALRLEGRRHGITATIIEPGDLSTGFTGSRILAEPANSPYYDECQRSVGQIAHDEQTGAGPESHRGNARQTQSSSAHRRRRQLQGPDAAQARPTGSHSRIRHAPYLYEAVIYEQGESLSISLPYLTGKNKQHGRRHR